MMFLQRNHWLPDSKPSRHELNQSNTHTQIQPSLTMFSGEQSYFLLLRYPRWITERYSLFDGTYRTGLGLWNMMFTNSRLFLGAFLRTGGPGDSGESSFSRVSFMGRFCVSIMLMHNSRCLSIHAYWNHTLIILMWNCMKWCMVRCLKIRRHSTGERRRNLGQDTAGCSEAGRLWSAADLQVRLAERPVLVDIGAR